MHWLRVRHGSLSTDRDRGLIQGEPWRVEHLGDGRHGFSLVIPIWRTERALRVGGYANWWAGVGPRRYTVVMTSDAVDDLARITHDDRAAVLARLREANVHIEGDLRSQT